MAPPPRAVVAVVAQVVAQVLADRLVAAVRLVRLQVAVVLVPLPQQPQVVAVRPVVVQERLPQQPEVAAAVALLLVQGLAASQILRSR